MCFLCDDPLPDHLDGDAAKVQKYAKSFGVTAQALRDAADELRALANEDISISLAVDEVREKADEVWEDTDKVATRYEGAESTFTAYGTDLASALSRGNGAISDIEQNNYDARTARHEVRTLEPQVLGGGADPTTVQDYQDAKKKADHYDALYSGYKGVYDKAVGDKADAVTTALSGLKEAEDSADLNDGWFDGILGDLQLIWEQISKYLGPVLEALRDILEVIKKIVDVLALIFTVLSIFLPFLAPLATALSALSVILSIAIFACSALLFLMGRESLGRVISDGIGMVVGIVTSKLGGGGSLTSQIRQGFTDTAAQGFRATFTTTRTAALAMNATNVQTYGNAVTEVLGSAGMGGMVGATGSVFSYLAESGPLDFEIDGPSAWSPEPNPVTDLLPGVLDGATFGTTSPLFNIATWDNDFAAPYEDMSNWGAVTVS